MSGRTSPRFTASTLAGLALVALTAGSGCPSGSEAKIDAAPLPATQIVNCTAAVTKEVTTGSGEYLPNSTTVRPGTIVRFVLGSQHTLRSNTNLFSIDFGQTECIKFNAPGTYDYFCTAHSFIGKVIVQ